MKLLSIVIPVYYNQSSLPLLFTSLLTLESKLKEKKVNLELIFVDDGSGDDSYLELLKIRLQKPSVKVIKHSRNFGAVRAVKTGLHFVTGDCFTFLAADMQDPPQLIEQMVDCWLSGAKYVTCVRSQRDDPLPSRFFSNLYYKLVRLFVVKDYPAGGFDLALMDQIMLPYLVKSGKNINISLFAYSLGFKSEVVYYHRQKRQHGKSRWSLKKRINYFIDSFIGFSIIPVRFISILGILLSILSFIYGSIVVFTVLAHESIVPGFSALATLISFLSGLLLIMLGIIGEYIWRIFDQLNGTPESVIETVLLD
jgi:glycosyltransferase involved in cell wall biosynthesis